eukprot:Platyproteum_vivax@DN1257_c0_g1_i1.p1
MENTQYSVTSIFGLRPHLHRTFCCGCSLQTAMFFMSILAIINGAAGVLTFSPPSAAVGILHCLFGYFGYQAASNFEFDKATLFFRYFQVLFVATCVFAVVWLAGGYFLLAFILQAVIENAKDPNMDPKVIDFVKKYQLAIALTIYISLASYTVVKAAIQGYFTFVCWCFREHVLQGNRLTLVYGNTTPPDANQPLQPIMTTNQVQPQPYA